MRITKNRAARFLALALSCVIAFGLLPPIVANAASATKVEIEGEDGITVYVGQVITLKARVDGDVESYWWQPSTPANETGSVRIDDEYRKGESCPITGVDVGIASVTVTIISTDGTKHTAERKVKVLPRTNVTEVIVTPKTAVISVDESTTLRATVNPANATSKDLIWESSNSSIVKVNSSDGTTITITGVGVGEATVNAYATDDSGKVGTCTVKVTARAEKITLNSTETIVVGNTRKLTATVLPKGAVNNTIRWETSDDTKVRIDPETGTITAVKVTAPDEPVIITAYIEDTAVKGEIVPGVTISAKCKVYVTLSQYPVEKLQFINAEATVIEKKTTPLVVNITPTNASNKALHLTSSDPRIATVPATVNAGASFLVTGVSPGPVTITARSAENSEIFAVCEVTVYETPKDPVTAIRLDPSESVLVVGGTVTPKVTLTPTVPTVKTVTWLPGDNNIAMVESTGKITATGPGITKITAKADGGDVSADVNVHVVALSDGKTTGVESLTLNQDGTATLSVANLPTSSGLTVSWASSKIATAKLSATSGTSVTVTGQGSGEAVITATVKRGTATVATLKCTVSVTGDINTIYYKITGAEAVSFNLNDFSTVCTNRTGNALSYIKFEQAKATDGALFYMYDKAGEARVLPTGLYYAASTPKISDVSFVPIPNFVGPAIINYTATDTKGNSYTGKINISVSDGTGDIKYSTGMNMPVQFNGEDFNEFCKKVSNGNTLNSVKFTLPASSDGVLYYLYELDSNQKVTGKNVTATTNYYYSSDAKISDITFLPATGFVGSVDIKFTGRDNKSNSISGTVRITVGKGTGSGADIEYKIDKNEVLYFNVDDFNDHCKIATGDNLSYVQFTLPSASRGILYYYDHSSGSSVNKSLTEATRLYRSTNPLLGTTHLVPYTDYEGTFTIKFTGQSTSGDKVSGTVGIIVGDAYGDVRYSAGINVPINFSNVEFNDFCKAELGANFEYIQFTLPKPTEGVLYYQYGRSGETPVTADKSYRRTAAPRLDDITFIPVEGFTGVIEFAFTGRSVSGKNLAGTVALTYDPNLRGMPVVYYSTSYMPVTLSGADLAEACSKRGDASLVSVKFVLPPESVGRLYENYLNHNQRGTPVSVSTSYSVGSGQGSVSSVTFAPRAETTGSVSIPYEGTDTKGDKFTGYVHITIPAVITSSFSDMDKHTWAVASVEYMRATSVVDGVGNNRYQPASPIKRGDFMLMLYRAFALSNTGSENFRDVPSGSYYAQAISAGKAIGIALGEPDGRFRPDAAITRQDAIVLIHRALEYLDRNVERTSPTRLNSFSDGKSVSDYAKDALADLVNAGVVRGDDQGKLNPRNPVTRAEMAVILHRVLTL